MELKKGLREPLKTRKPLENQDHLENQDCLENQDRLENQDCTSVNGDLDQVEPGAAATKGN